MNLRTKKIIKRELSIITTILSLALIFGLCIYPYNANKHSKIHAIEDMINSQKKFSDSLSAQFNGKLSIQKKFSDLLSAA
jgi:ATP/ADP translocase